MESIATLEDLEVIFWDFDGVLMNSNTVRDLGFIEVLKEYPKEQVDRLMKFHQSNGGLSRYVKFRYFFENIRQRPISDEEVIQWAQRFSAIMRDLLVDSELLIGETLEFVKTNSNDLPMHIVSGSDQEELRYLCNKLEISEYFKSIHGSPKPKTKWVNELLDKYNYNRRRSILVGDSKNDFEAARDNGIHFMGYNNDALDAFTTKRFSLE